MRPVGFDDLRTAARALMAVPQDARGALCARLLQRARWADCYVKRLSKLHPQWGDGTLRAAARPEELAHERWLGDQEYRDCCMLVLSMLDPHVRVNSQ